MKRRELLVLLLHSVFGCLAIAAIVLYHGHVGIPGKVAVAAVVVLYAVASIAALHGKLHVLDFAIRATPMLALLGTASGFLIAFSGDISDVQQRVAGASTGLAATIAGIACTLVLMLQKEILTAAPECVCGEINTRHCRRHGG